MGNKTYKFKPDWLHLVPPGKSIIKAMKELGLSQSGLAERTDYTTKHIYKLVKGEATINANTALRLEKVLGPPAHFWLNLENNYREALEKEKEKENLHTQIDWLKEIPLNDMVKLKWVNKVTDKSKQIVECLKFYGVASIELWYKQNFKNVAFKSYEKINKNEVAIHTWVRAGEIEASKISCKPYNKKRLKLLLTKLRNLTMEENPEKFIPELKKMCSKVGIAIVFMPTPKGCPIGGATKWLTPEKALLMLSLRYKTNDHLWFSFFHEVAHILEHSKKLLFLENTKFTNKLELENDADKFSRDFLIPEKYINDLQSLKTQKDIKDFAEKINIASGIVVGRMQHDKLIEFSQHNSLKIRYKFG